MTAALYGDAALVTRLLAAGADPNARNSAGATALMWAAPDVAKMRALLDAGADVNAHSDDRRSPLVITTDIVGAAPALRLLLEYGADASPWQASDPSPLREAARVDDCRDVSPADGVRRQPEERRRAVRDVSAHQLFHVRAAGRRGWRRTAAALPPPPGAGATAPRYDPGPSARPTRGRRDARRHPRQFTPPSSAACRCCRTSAPRSSSRPAACRAITTASCRWRSTAARANGYAVNEAVAAQQAHAIGALSRVVARSHGPEHSDRRRQRHDQLPDVRSRGRQAIRPTPRPTRRRSG